DIGPVRLLCRIDTLLQALDRLDSRSETGDSRANVGQRPVVSVQALRNDARAILEGRREHVCVLLEVVDRELALLRLLLELSESILEPTVCALGDAKLERQSFCDVCLRHLVREQSSSLRVAVLDPYRDEAGVLYWRDRKLSLEERGRIDRRHGPLPC